MPRPASSSSRRGKKPARKPKKKSPARPKVSKAWRDLVTSLPGYDPHLTAGESWFDPDRAQLAIDFFHEMLKHVEGPLAGVPFKLERWQQAIIANLFGWVRKDDKGRVVLRYRELFLYVPRKNGKTPLAAGICLFVLFVLREPGAQIYSAAADKDQAALLYRHARGMVEREPELAERAVIYKAFKSIVLKEDPAASYKVLSADADTKHGQNSSLILIDELHALPNRDLVDVLTTGTASANRLQPLTVFITTADFERPSICNEKYDQACRVRDNPGDPAMPGYDGSFLPVVFESKPEEDWTDPAVWQRANPNYGVSVSKDYLARECQKAVEQPALENTYRRLHLNQRTKQQVKGINLDHWKKCGHGADPLAWRREMIQRLRGRPCFGGLDLANTGDLNAFALLFPEEPKPWPVLLWFWTPQASVDRRRRDRIPYDVWVSQGYMKATDGDVTDYEVLRKDINDLGDQFGIRDIAVDRLFQGLQLCTQLAGDGLEVKEFGQGFYTMAAPVKQFQELLSAGELHHGNNPVLTWMAGHAGMQLDPAGNQKFDKVKSKDKIDGLVASVMALGRAMVSGSSTSVYESQGITAI